MTPNKAKLCKHFTIALFFFRKNTNIFAKKIVENSGKLLATERMNIFKVLNSIVCTNLQQLVWFTCIFSFANRQLVVAWHLPPSDFSAEDADLGRQGA
jgi:hypothetical protein